MAIYTFIQGYAYAEAIARALKSGKPLPRDRFGHSLSNQYGIITTIVSRSDETPSVKVVALPRRGIPYQVYQRVFDTYLGHREV